MVKANLRILLNCCYEPQFKVYAGAFDWSTLLPRLLNSGMGAVQLATKFISSCLASGLPDACESFWKLKGSDVDLLLKTLGKIIQTGEDPLEVNDFSFFRHWISSLECKNVHIAVMIICSFWVASLSSQSSQ